MSKNYIGVSFSLRLILTILIAAPIHVFFGLDDPIALSIGAVIAFLPKLGSSIFSQALNLIFHIGKGIFYVLSNIIQGIFHFISRVFGKGKKGGKYG
ncbi:hypothetical protein [Bernardetia sp.]|uniref:hypothetical protein n=1 Tax=Bernardetia sp. TaxID=1937974 RepID=UPI0025BBD33A|nr:hypothetical protein [Bernardetia sp.]